MSTSPSFLNKWFFGVVDQPGIWAISAARPGVDIVVRNYSCAQDMSPCWVAYLGQIPPITHPKQITFKDMSLAISAGFPVHYNNAAYYESKELEDCLKSLDIAKLKIKEIEKQIHDRANKPTP